MKLDLSELKVCEEELVSLIDDTYLRNERGKDKVSQEMLNLYYEELHIVRTLIKDTLAKK